MSTPGAATEMYFPRLAPVNNLSLTSVAVTAITYGSAPGNSGGDFGPALPAAAIRTMPLSYAALSARSSEGSLGPAKLILMMRAPSCTDQLMPLRMLNVVLSAVAAVVEKACTASSRAAGAVPSKRWCAAMAPAVPVRLLRRANRVEALRHGALEVGMRDVDFRIDHRDRHVGAADQAVDVGNLELL